MSQDVFFSFTTLTTTGYGNLVPAGQPGQSLAVMEMIIGQLFLVTALGKIVSVWRPGTWADRKAGGCRPGRVRRRRPRRMRRREVGELSDVPSASEAGQFHRAGARGLVLLALILVAAVANLNLAVANVALPSIGAAFDSSQTALDLIAVGYSLGLAASVLYLGALGDRHGRKLMLIVGTALAIPASLLAAYAPTDTILFVARLLGGLAAGMAYPTTLALITALWSGPARTKSIALWSALGGAISALGPLLSGLLLEHFWWGSVFLLTLPLAVVALVLAIRLVPAHVNETTDPVDNLGGILSVLLIAAVVLAINFAPVPNEGRWSLGSSPSPSRRASRSSSANAAPATPCTTCTSRVAGSSGSRRAPASSCSAR